MVNVVYGHFEAAGSLHTKFADLCRDGNNNRLIRLYAGALAECLLNYEDWKEALDSYFNMCKPLHDGLEATQWADEDYAVRSFVLDKDLELGRAIVRLYLDETPETSFLMLRNIRASLLSLIGNDQAFWDKLYDITLTCLTGEQLLHHLCDHVIEICIGTEGWTLGDCVQSMAALSGRYHAKVIEVYNLGLSRPAVIDHDFDFMMKTMMNEAMRLGMPEHAGIYTMLAANDTQPYIPHHKANGIDVIAKPLFTVMGIVDPDLKSMLIAKATGRMMAVAAAGDDPDMDACVVTPLALSCLQGSYNSFLNMR
jgi:hypothetical protein